MSPSKDHLKEGKQKLQWISSLLEKQECYFFLNTIHLLTQIGQQTFLKKCHESRIVSIDQIMNQKVGT